MVDETTRVPALAGASTLPDFNGYDVRQIFHSGLRSVVYRAIELTSGRAVMLKMPRNVYPSDRELAAQKRAFDIARSVSSVAVAEHIALFAHQSNSVLVTEDFGGISLESMILQEDSPGIEDGLEISIALAQALAELHREHIIHRDIKPANVIWNARTRELRLIDLTNCSQLEQDAGDLTDSYLVEGSLTYMAPEQTGRTNRPIDYRADLYSLGVTLFELFTGRPPFDFSNSRELLHAHLARAPALLNELVPSIPAQVGVVINTLLAKDPEDRYASALGLAKDLRRCLDGVRAGNLVAFDPGLDEMQSWLVLPNRLYGRDAERDTLRAALNVAASGARQAVLVAGYSGVGKSALIKEIHADVAACGGWYCSGKFDQFRRDVPYIGWRSVLQSLVRQLLARPEHSLDILRKKLNQASAGNISLIAELVPELQTVLGEQPAPPSVGPAEARQRFTQAFRNFVRVIAESERLIVLFVDDLQWADSASLKLLEALVSDRSSANVLVLGAYRDNEAGAGHQLTATIDALQQGGHSLSIMKLASLSQEHIARFVSDTVKPATESTNELAQLVFGKTGGNPFFVRQFLTSLYRQNLLTFDLGRSSWFWNLATIESQHFTDNVIDLLTARIAELSPETREAIQCASCLGSEFKLQTLAEITDRPISQMAADLEQAMIKGLIVPINADYRYAAGEARLAERDGRPVDINPSYQFLHDRLQQTAHEGLEPEQRARMHLRIVRRLAAEDDQSGNLALDAMDHLGHSISLVSSLPERLQFARLCLSAGRKARAAMAIEPAKRYLEMGRTLLPNDAWQAELRLALDLNVEAADIAYIDEDFDQALALGSTAIEHATSLSDRVTIHNIRIGIGAAQQRYVDATRYGVDILGKELGIKIGQSVSTVNMLNSVVATRLALVGYDDEAILNLPDMDDKRLLAAKAMMMKCATNAYWANQLLVPVLAGHMLRLSLRHGKSGYTAYGLALLGMIITQALNSPNYGCRLGALAMDLLERIGDRNLVGKTGLLWHGMIRHSKEPLRLCMADTLECYHHAMDAGDVENAVYCGVVAHYGDLLSGRSLDWVEKRYRNYIPALLDSGQKHSVLALRVWVQVVANLGDCENVQPRAVGDIVNWPLRLSELLEEEGTDVAIATVVGGTGWLAFILGDLQEAEQQWSLLYEREQNALGQCFWKPCMALYAAVLARKLSNGNATLRDRRRLKRLRRALRQWAIHNAHDYACFSSALDAEIANGKGRHQAALMAWTDAMEQARESGFLYVAAWAAEQAAAAHEQAGHARSARDLMRRARRTWRKHGSFARLRMLSGGADSSTDLEYQNDNRVDGQLAGLDFDAVLTAVRAISGGLEVDKLAERVLELSLLSAGARKGVLLTQDRTLTPFVTAKLDSRGGVETSRAKFDDLPSQLPMSLVDYVVRTSERLLVDDAQTHEWLVRDPYVSSAGCRSLLAMPLLRQGELVGLVLLENDLGTGLFSESDATVVQIIAGQAAISLENARLFDAQRRQTEAFSRFVPRQFLEHLGHDSIEDVRLGDAVERRVTVMFVDLREFTALSESMDINENFALINAFIERMAPIIKRHGGFIAEFTGDGFKALFIENPEGAAHAAIGIQIRLRHYNVQRVEKGRPHLRMGVGVHTGQALLGTVGAQDRTSTTIIGDTVNTAARLEGITKLFATPSLISSITREGLADPLHFAMRHVGRVRVKGRQQPISVYELIDARDPKERDVLLGSLELFNEAMCAYEVQNFAVAADLFSRCVSLLPDDLLSRYYYNSATELLNSGVSSDWDGVIVRKEK